MNFQKLTILPTIGLISLIHHACIPLQNKNVSDIIDGQPASQAYRQQTKGFESFVGPFKKSKTDDRLFQYYRECPDDEEFYLSETEVNTFEVGLTWYLPLPKHKMKKKPKGYTNYRCIPR